MSIESDIIQFLQANLDVPVSTAVPKNRSERFVTVERTGGLLDQFRDLPVFAIQSWGESTRDASDLNDAVRKALPHLTELMHVAHVNVGGTYNYPDPDSGQARYQTVCDLVTAWPHP